MTGLTRAQPSGRAKVCLQATRRQGHRRESRVRRLLFELRPQGCDRTEGLWIRAALPSTAGPLTTAFGFEHPEGHCAALRSFPVLPRQPGGSPQPCGKEVGCGPLGVCHQRPFPASGFGGAVWERQTPHPLRTNLESERTPGFRIRAPSVRC